MVSGLSKRIQEFREGVQRKQKARRAKQRAKGRQERIAERKQEAKERARARRIEKNEPESLGEEAEASLRQVKLLSSELGISASDAREVVEQANNVLEDAQEQGGGALEALDLDGDGDTDLLQSFEGQTNELDTFELEDRLGGSNPGGSASETAFDPGAVAFDPFDIEEPGMSSGKKRGSGDSGVDPASAEFEKDLLDL